MGHMIPNPRDLAQTRHDNALLLFDEFVNATVKHPDSATLRGLEGRFAERLQIQPSYWSQIKGRSRQIGERLARQFEQLCRKPAGWMDAPHAPHEWAGSARPPTGPGSRGAADAAAAPTPGAAVAADDRLRNAPQDDDERFIVGLVLTYYRRHPQRARTRLLDLLGEVLVPPPPAPVQAAPGARTGAAPEDPHELWNQTQAAVKPLKPRR